MQSSENESFLRMCTLWTRRRISPGGLWWMIFGFIYVGFGGQSGCCDLYAVAALWLLRSPPPPKRWHLCCRNDECSESSVTDNRWRSHWPLVCFVLRPDKILVILCIWSQAEYCVILRALQLLPVPTGWKEQSTNALFLNWSRFSHISHKSYFRGNILSTEKKQNVENDIGYCYLVSTCI